MNFQVLLSLTLFFLTTIVIEYSSSASAQDKAILPEISIDQDDLTPSANLSFDKIVASGRHLFSTPYNHEDGYGEGVDGPRRKNQELFPHSSFPFLRLNGLDSQSCFECHNSIGSAAPMDSASANSKALARKIGANGGPAGFASNAYINPDFNDNCMGSHSNDKVKRGQAQQYNLQLQPRLLIMRFQIDAYRGP